jgi:uncharacterized protein (DUF697 family)
MPSARQRATSFDAETAGRRLGWLPGLGNAINAVTAAVLTEAIGWAADAYFADGHFALGRS